MGYKMKPGSKGMHSDDTFRIDSPMKKMAMSPMKKMAMSPMKKGMMGDAPKMSALKKNMDY